MDNKKMIIAFAGIIGVMVAGIGIAKLMMPSPNPIISCHSHSMGLQYDKEEDAFHKDPDFYVRSLTFCLQQGITQAETKEEKVTMILDALQKNGWYEVIGRTYMSNWDRLSEANRLSTFRQVLVSRFHIFEAKNLYFEQLRAPEFKDNGDVSMLYELKADGRGVDVGAIAMIIAPLEEYKTYYLKSIGSN